MATASPSRDAHLWAAERERPGELTAASLVGAQSPASGAGSVQVGGPPGSAVPARGPAAPGTLPRTCLQGLALWHAMSCVLAALLGD